MLPCKSENSFFILPLGSSSAAWNPGGVFSGHRITVQIAILDWIESLPAREAK
jgi:hypothetical protein